MRYRLQEKATRIRWKIPKGKGCEKEKKWKSNDMSGNIYRVQEKVKESRNKSRKSYGIIITSGYISVCSIFVCESPYPICA